MRASTREGFRLVEYSIQTNHLHLIVEADDRKALGRGMKGLLISVARRLNGLWGRKGRVFADRYFMRVVSSAVEVWRLLKYVLLNGRKHGQRFEGVDPYSSGPWFEGWSGGRHTLPCFEEIERPTARARSRILRDDWLMLRPLFVDERPAFWEACA